MSYLMGKELVESLIDEKVRGINPTLYAKGDHGDKSTDSVVINRSLPEHLFCHSMGAVSELLTLVFTVPMSVGMFVSSFF
jgi:hypothetical protein